MDSEEESAKIRSAQPYGLGELVQYADGAVVSRTLAETDHGTLTLFAFDGGQHLSEHTTPFDAYVVGLDGHHGHSHPQSRAGLSRAGGIHRS